MDNRSDSNRTGNDFQENDLEQDRKTLEEFEKEALSFEKTNLPFEEISQRYKFIRFIGGGSCATVFKGYDKKLSHPVAIKILPRNLAEKEEYISRFMLEAKVAARLRHPNIIRIYDVGEQEGVYYIVMDYLPGHDLRTRLNLERRFTRDKIIMIIKDICSALEYAHIQGVIHRDLKPANIMFDKYEKAVLVDFGIAKAALEARITHSGTLLGSPAYMSPELFIGKEANPASDIYSLGIVFYELLSGKVPFEGNSLDELKEMHLTMKPPTLDNEESYIQSIIKKSLSKEPEHRFFSIRDFLDALEKKAIVESYEEGIAEKKSETNVARQKSRKITYLSCFLILISACFIGITSLFFLGKMPDMSFIPGFLILDTSPDNAGFIIKGENEDQQGKVSKNRIKLPPGNYLLTIEEQGFQSKYAKIEIKSGEHLKLRIDLVPKGIQKHPLTGSDLVWIDNFIAEKNGRFVNHPGVWMMAKEVTVDEYTYFLNKNGNKIEGGISYIDLDNPKSLIELKDGVFKVKSGFANYPVNLVSYYGAVAYAKWSSGFLPTEDEWISASCIDIKKRDTYPWGDYPRTDLSNNKDYSGDLVIKRYSLNEDGTGIIPVGLFIPTGKGFFDLAGNVSEWCRKDKPENSNTQIIKGGSYKDNLQSLSCCYYEEISANSRLPHVGFRIAYPSKVLERNK
ncbi:MAG: protein kinase [Candidatus Coatesbacteria bacterium]|nr:protein kinase [Candidatus Coatesbacteria bacterium]